MIGIVIAVVITASLLMGQAASKKVIEANEFVLKDGNNRSRAKLFLDNLNSAHLALIDERGNETVDVWDLGVVDIKDMNGKSRAQLFMGGTGPILSFFDSKAKKRAELAVNDTVQSLTFFDANEKTRTSLLTFDEMGSSLMLYGEDKDHGARLQGGTGPFHTSLRLDDTAPVLELADKDGFKTTIGVTSLVTPRTGETHTTSAASVILFDKDKKALWKAP